MYDLSGRVALVTGAGPNIGRVIAATLARAGATVLCNDLKPEIAQAAAKAASDGKAFPLPFDITDPDAVDKAVEGADVIMMLRIQMERMQGAFFPSLREYFTVFGLTSARVARAKPDVIIMHPGPMNRGVEIASEVADGPYSVIFEQVANGVAVRMAVLYLLAGGAEEAD